MIFMAWLICFISLQADPSSYMLFIEEYVWSNLMNEKVLKTLEYNKIIDQLTEKASCEPGRKRCRELLPMENLSDIEKAKPWMP